MRNLTIKRAKNFVACLAKMKVYIEDSTTSEIVINNVPCRKIGELKNGEEKTFSINESEANLFVIADQISKNYCNEFYKIPAGENDIFISGRNYFNPASGNAFRFDGVANEEVLQNRKRSTRKGIIILCVSIIIGLIAGLLIGFTTFSSKGSEQKTFYAEGMQITLTDNFVEASMEGYTACYDSKDVAVFTLKESFSLFDGFKDYTLEQYFDLMLENNNFNSSVNLQNYEGLTYFEYQYNIPESNDTYNYFTLIFKSSDAFWMIQFSTLEQNAENYSQTFIDWAKSVKFSNS